MRPKDPKFTPQSSPSAPPNQTSRASIPTARNQADDIMVIAGPHLSKHVIFPPTIEPIYFTKTNESEFQKFVLQYLVDDQNQPVDSSDRRMEPFCDSQRQNLADSLQTSGAFESAYISGKDGSELSGALLSAIENTTRTFSCAQLEANGWLLALPDLTPQQ